MVRLLYAICTHRNDSVKMVTSCTVPHSPFSLLGPLHFQRHHEGLAFVAVFRSLVFSYKNSNWMYTETSDKVFVELFDLKDETILSSLFLRLIVQKNEE